MTHDERDVLAANEAFYAAFAHKDAAAMDSLWARETPVTCLHPGWQNLVGRDSVIDSWRRILLGGGAPPRIRCHRPVARTMGEIGWVVCEEVLPGGSLAATNVFVREQNAWRIVHHHASPVPAAGTEPEGLPN